MAQPPPKAHQSVDAPQATSLRIPTSLGGSFPSKLCYVEHLWRKPTRPWTRMGMDIPASSFYTRARAHKPLGTITLHLYKGYNFFTILV